MVVETLRKQCKDDCVKATVAIYGLAEGGTDSVDVSELFNKLKWNGRVLHQVRIGRTPAAGNKKKPRLIKAELSTSLDCDHLLSAAKKLKTDHAMANIIVARWIP